MLFEVLALVVMQRLLFLFTHISSSSTISLACLFFSTNNHAATTAATSIIRKRGESSIWERQKVELKYDRVRCLKSWCLVFRYSSSVLWFVALFSKGSHFLLERDVQFCFLVHFQYALLALLALLRCLNTHAYGVRQAKWQWQPHAPPPTDIVVLSYVRVRWRDISISKRIIFGGVALIFLVALLVGPTTQ